MATEVRSLLDEGAARLARAADEPRREAEVLLGAALGRSRAWLLAHPEERVLDCEATDRYEAYLTRRSHGEPVAYLLGEKEFWSLPLKVGPGVLIPRPETELVVERALARARPHGQVTATDVSPLAVAAARDNAARLGLGGRVTVIEGSWFEPVAGRPFDLVVSNPPYIAEDDPRVETAVRRYEPHGALFAGPDGLAALRPIVAGAPRHLRPGGWLIVEHGDVQGSAVRDLFAQAGLGAVATHRDLAGRDRCTEGRLPG